MKKYFYPVLVILVVLVLTACQAAPTAPPPTPTAAATPTETVITEFFQNLPERWITVNAPAGWVAKPGGSLISPNVILTDNWTGYQNNNGTAIGITILPLADQGSAEQVLQISVQRLKDSLTQPAGKITLEQAAGQSYASVEYGGNNPGPDGSPAYYFLTVISTDKRSVLVFISSTFDQKEQVRPAFQNAVKAITLH